MMIRLAHPRFPDSALEMLRQVLETGNLTAGRFAASLEEKLSARLDGRHVVLVSSGTTASLIAFHILKERSYSTLLMPDFCFPSVASSAIRSGFSVKLLDIEPNRLGLDLARTRQQEPDESAMLVTIDQFGIPAPGAEAACLAQEKSWGWFEDSACAFGSFDEDTPCGTLATMSILSFHPRKTLTTGEGGALVTADPDMAEQARLLRNLGLSGEGAQRRFEQLGYNARMSELHAVAGLAQLEEFDSSRETRRELGGLYLELLNEIDGLSVPEGYALPGANFQSLVVILGQGTDRDRAIGNMYGRGIECSIPGFAIHKQSVFRDLEALGPLDNSLALHEQGLALPLHQGLSESDVRFVVRELREVVNHV